MEEKIRRNGKKHLTGHVQRMRGSVVLTFYSAVRRASIEVDAVLHDSESHEVI